MGYPSYYYVIVATQAICLLHALKHRADQRWFYAIVFAPGIGGVVYLLVEVLPSLRRAGLPRIDLPLFERLQVGALERLFRFSDTIDNRVALAEAYLNNRRLAEALELYRPVIAGPFKANPYLLFGYARACFANAAYDEAVGVLESAERGGSTAKARERKLLLAMALDKLGRAAEAEAAFTLAMVGFTGEEVRCRYALFLWDHARRDEAATLFAQVVEWCGHSERDYRRREKVWLRLAKERLAEHKKAASARAAA